MTRRYPGSSAACSLGAGSRLEEIVVAAAVEARRRGLRVTTAEAVEAARLLSIYIALAGGSVPASEAAGVVASVFAKHAGEMEAARQAFLDVICRRDRRVEFMRLIESDLRSIGASFGEEVPGWKRRRVLSSSPASYARLRLLGIIRRGRRGEYVVSRAVAESIVKELLRRYGGPREALEALVRREAARGGRLLGLLGVEALEYMSGAGLREALALYRAARDRATREAAARAVADALLRGERPRGAGEAAEALEALSRHGLLDRRLARALLESEPRLGERVARLIGREELLDLAEEMARDGLLEEAAEAVAKGLGLGFAAARGALEALRRGLPLDAATVARLGAAASVYEYAARFLAGGGEGYLDMARAEAEKLGRSSPDVALLVEALESGAYVEALRILSSRLPLRETIELLSTVYAGSGDRALRVYALTLMAMLWRRTVARVGGRAGRRKIIVEGRGSAGTDMRETIYATLRLEPRPLRGLEAARVRRLVLALDKSGSMKPHAFYALAAAAALAPLVDRLVVFDAAAEVYDRASLPKNPYRVAEMLLETRFSGYTDAVGAIRRAVEGLPPRRLVLVSDLKQTVAAQESVVDALYSVASRGWKVTVIAPRQGVDAEAVRLLRGKPRVRVLLVSSPSEVARALLAAVSRS